MNETDFSELLQSVREAKQILRGERKADREFVVEVPPATAQSATGYALCVQTDDAALLMPRKVYTATYSQAGLLRVTDEAGEIAVYPQEFFYPSPFPKRLKRYSHKWRLSWMVFIRDYGEHLTNVSTCKSTPSVEIVIAPH